MPKEHIVIVGCGMGGAKLVEELLGQDPAGARFQISIVGEEEHGNYDRIKLVQKLRDDAVEGFWLNSAEWYQEKKVAAYLDHRVTHIDSERKLIRSHKELELHYDKLVLALGARPFVPPIEGVKQEGVFTLRSLSDALEIRKAIAGKSKIMVIGGGILGLELAYGLKSIGKQVLVSHLMPRLMEKQLDDGGAAILMKKLTGKGMEFVIDTYVVELRQLSDGRLSALFQNRVKKEIDAVIINTGITPVKLLAELAGIFTNRGILVDSKLQTSVKDIFALGECIEHRGKTWGLIAPVYEQARCLAAILNGQDIEYRDTVSPPVRLKCDIPVLTMGQSFEGQGDQVISFNDPKSMIYKKLILQGECLAGAILVGDERNLDAISLHYSAKLPLPEDIAQLLFPGSGEAEAELPDTSAWPDDITICDCNGISAGRVREVIAAGNDTEFSAVKVSRAGTGCGTCKNRVKALLLASVGELKEDPRAQYYLPGIPMKRAELEEFISTRELRSVSEVLDALLKAKGDALTRMGLDYLLGFIWKGDYVEQKDSKFVNDRYHGNIQKDGTFSVIPRAHGGVITPEQLQRMADVAKKYKVKMIKVTGADRLALFSFAREDLPKVWADLDMDSGHAYGKYFRSAKSCVGSDFCRFGLKDSIRMGEMMDDRYRGTIFPAKLKMGASGCPRNCAEATIKDFGVVASGTGWDIFIGGNGGAKVEAAQKLTKVQTDEEVFQIADRFLEYYRRHGLYHERTSKFVARIGLEKIRDAVLFDTEQNLREMEESFAEYRERYQDPWKQEETWQKKPQVIDVGE